MQIYANKSHDFLQFSAKITATQANYDMKYVIETYYEIIVDPYFHNYFSDEIGRNWTKMNQQ